jgi:hypothetical protein
MVRRTWLVAGSALFLGTAAAADAPYGIEISSLAQRYYRQCRAEKLLLDQFSRDFNEKHLPQPPYTSFREALTPADRRDAELVCLGATLQQFDDINEEWKRSQAAEPSTGQDKPPG